MDLLRAFEHKLRARQLIYLIAVRLQWKINAIKLQIHLFNVNHKHKLQKKTPGSIANKKELCNNCGLTVAILC